MRHAKSSWGDSSVSDHDRVLNSRGRRDSPAMADWLLDQGFKPDWILCSSAARTRETAQRMNDQWPRTVGVLESPSLYLASPEAILHTIGSTGARNEHPTCANLMVLAHNPGISSVATHLTGECIQMPTAAVVVLRCDIASWQDPLSAENVAFIAEMIPKRLDE